MAIDVTQHTHRKLPMSPMSKAPAAPPPSRRLQTPFPPRPDVELCRRGELRSERILDAATEVFIEKGYRGASLSAIVGRAGGSMSTLYRVFGNKEGLAHAIVERHMATVTERLQRLNLLGLLPESALCQVGESILDATLSPESLLLHRIVIGEGRDFPGLRDWFFDHAVMPAQAILTEYLEHEVEAGRLALRFPAIASSQFFMMIFGELIIRAASGNQPEPDPATAHNDARAAVDLFLHGALPR